MRLGGSPGGGPRQNIKICIWINIYDIILSRNNSATIPGRGGGGLAFASPLELLTTIGGLLSAGFIKGGGTPGGPRLMPPGLGAPGGGIAAPGLGKSAVKVDGFAAESGACWLPGGGAPGIIGGPLDDVYVV